MTQRGVQMSDQQVAPSVFLCPELPEAALHGVFGRLVETVRWHWRISRVNGQVAVPGGGQLKVPTPRVDHFLVRLEVRPQPAERRNRSPLVSGTRGSSGSRPSALSTMPAT
jgi:hypothetical protein